MHAPRHDLRKASGQVVRVSKAFYVAAVPIVVFAIAACVVAVRSFTLGRRLLRADRGARAAAVLVGGLLWAGGLAATPWLGVAMVMYIRNLPHGCGGAWGEHPVRVSVLSAGVATVLGMGRAAAVAALSVQPRRA